jgi:rSAM/selenodomain-associated transferase 2
MTPAVSRPLSSSAPLVSVIVPVLGDRALAARLLRQVPADPRLEVVVADAGREPGGEALAGERPDVTLIQSAQGRATQMNAGAALARGEWLLFLHADSVLPDDWLTALVAAAAPPAVGGWFRFALDDAAWQARVIERGVALRVRLLRLPYGDQGLFVHRRAWTALGGYGDLPIMEDVDLIRRLARLGPVVEVPRAIATSARRWRRDGWFRRSGRNLALLALYALGVPPARLARWYERPASSGPLV